MNRLFFEIYFTKLSLRFFAVIGFKNRYFPFSSRCVGCGCYSNDCHDRYFDCSLGYIRE